MTRRPELSLDERLETLLAAQAVPDAESFTGEDFLDLISGLYQEARGDLPPAARRGR